MTAPSLYNLYESYLRMDIISVYIFKWICYMNVKVQLAFHQSS